MIERLSVQLNTASPVVRHFSPLELRAESFGEILGAQIIGPRASDLIHEVAVAMKAEMTAEELANTVYSHPTLSEAIMEAAEDCFGLATLISR